MAKTKAITSFLSELPKKNECSALSLLNINGSALETAASSILQRLIMLPQTTKDAINIDTDRINGIFSLYYCTGTKPTTYGVVLNHAMGDDMYQLVIGSNSRMYQRMIGKSIGKWTRLSYDPSYEAPETVS